MNPTQPNSGHRRWFAHPDFHYSISHRFNWPSYLAEGPGVASSAATGAANAASAGAAGVAEGAAASGAFGAGGGFPPRGPYGGYHHYYDGRYPYGRPFGRRLFLRRFIWVCPFPYCVYRLLMSSIVWSGYSSRDHLA